MSGRAYIFAWTSPEHKAFVNIPEWCAEGVKPEIDRMQSIPIEKMPNWVRQFEMGEPVISRDWEAGMNEHLSKPQEETKVLCAIQKYVKKSPSPK